MYKIKRVVITSSVAAIYQCLPQDRPKNNIYNETHWSNPVGNHIDAYHKSKTLAERAAWDFQKNLPEHERFEIVTINPSLIVGPAFVDAGFSSGEVINQVMNNPYVGQPQIYIGLVDVRECATAHLLALKKKEAAN